MGLVHGKNGILTVGGASIVYTKFSKKEKNDLKAIRMANMPSGSVDAGKEKQLKGFSSCEVSFDVVIGANTSFPGFKVGDALTNAIFQAVDETGAVQSTTTFPSLRVSGIDLAGDADSESTISISASADGGWTVS